MSAMIGFIIAGIGTFFACFLLVPPPTGTGTMGYGLGGWFVAFIAAAIGLFVGMIGGTAGRLISKTPPAGIGGPDSEALPARRDAPWIGAFLGGVVTVLFFAVIFGAM